MKKFKVELTITTEQKVYYEVEAESRQELDELLLENCVEDIGTCIDEDAPEYYNEEVTDIIEK